MAWKRPEWFEDLPPDVQKKIVAAYDLEGRELSRRQAKWILVVCVIGMLVIVAACLAW